MDSSNTNSKSQSVESTDTLSVRSTENLDDSQKATPLSKPRKLFVLVAVLIDLVLLLVFAGLGRSSHKLELNLLAVFETAWPFFVALLLAWCSSWTFKQPFRIWPTGVWIWLVTVLVGLTLRYLSHGFNLAPAFALVAAATLALFFIGWRLVYLLVVAIRKMRSPL